MHSILITHRNRNKLLGLCLWSIHRSAAICGVVDYEVVIVENGSQRAPEVLDGHERLIIDHSEMPVFNKPALYCRAIDEARGDVLTFLDGDMLVGRHWMAGVEAFEEVKWNRGGPNLIRLCYRVRNLSQGALETVLAAGDRDGIVAELFKRYEDWQLAWECYGRPDCPEIDPGKPVFGNSQFSVTRANLGDLRPNCDYVGKGCEDVEFVRQFARRYGDRYRGLLRTEAEWSLLHLPHARDGPSWADGAYSRRQWQMYRNS